MTVSVADFRKDFPEFADAVRFADPGVVYWLNLGTLLLSTERWGAGAAGSSSPPTTVYDVGLELFAAHHLAIERRAQDEAATGAVPGGTAGPVSGKSVGPVSVSYDVSAGIELDAGHWNLTVYGTRFIRMARMFGMGPVQISGSGSPSGADPLTTGPGWPGPFTNPSQTGFG